MVLQIKIELHQEISQNNFFFNFAYPRVFAWFINDDDGDGYDDTHLFEIFPQVFDDIIFAFFTLEMTIKMVAMGIYGHGTYLADSWNRLDFFIVMAG